MSGSPNDKRHKTEEKIDRDLDKLMFMAAEEKLLPKIIYQYSFENGPKKFVNQYRNEVKQIYT